jgi:hypothetical protein
MDLQLPVQSVPITTKVVSSNHAQARCTTLCDKVCQWLATDRWFSPVSFTNKTDCHDITEILLKVALNTINQHKPTRIRKSKNRHHIAKRKRTNNDLQNTTQKTKEPSNTNLTKISGWTRVLRKGSSSCSTSGTQSCYSSSTWCVTYM